MHEDFSSENGEDMVRSDANFATFFISLLDCMDMFVVFSVVAVLVLGLRYIVGALGLNDRMKFLGKGVHSLDFVIGRWGDEDSMISGVSSKDGRNGNCDVVRLPPDWMFEGSRLTTSSVGLGVL
jgi:hypothetical protein